MTYREAIVDALNKLAAIPDNFDGQGSKSVDNATLNKARALLIMSSLYDRESPYIPNVGIGPEGSVDIYWKNQQFTLLINIPKEEQATYYGNNRDIECKGTFSVKSFPYERLELLIRLLT